MKGPSSCGLMDIRGACTCGTRSFAGVTTRNVVPQ